MRPPLIVTLLLALLAGAALAQPVSPPKKLAVDALPKPPAPPPDVAAQFAEAEAALQRFEALEFKFDPDADIAAWSREYGQFMQAQTKALSELQTQYGRIATSGAPQYAIPALVRAGEVMDRFASSLTNLQLPNSFPAEQRKAVMTALEQGGDGLRQMSRGYYEQAVRRADADGLKGEWIDFARKRLAELAPKPVLAVPPPPPPPPPPKND